MIISLLVSLGVGMMICLAGSIVSEPSEVGFRVLLSFLNFNGNTFNLQKIVRNIKVTYLIILKSNFDLEVVGHHEFVSFNRIKMMLVLLLTLRSILLLLHLHLVCCNSIKVVLLAVLELSVHFHLLIVFLHLCTVHLTIYNTFHLLLLLHLHFVIVYDPSHIHLLLTVDWHTFHVHDLLIFLLLSLLLILLHLLSLPFLCGSVSIFLLSFLLFTHILKL